MPRSYCRCKVLPLVAVLLALASAPLIGCSNKGREQLDGAKKPAAASEGNEASGQGPAKPSGTGAGGIPQPQSLDPQQQAKALAEFNRGAAMLEQYQYGDAVKAFQKAVELVPGWTAAWFNLALAHFNTEAKGLEDCRAECEKILESHPENLHARFLLGMYYQHAGKNQEALECYQKVHQADPQDVYAAYKCAETLSSLGRNEEATTLLEQVVKQDPGFVSSHYRLFSLYQRGRQREKAAPLVQRFKELSDAELDGKMFTVGNPYGSSGKYTLAMGPEGLPAPKSEMPQPRVLFSPEVREIAAPMKAWKWSGGSVGIPGIAVGDLNGDGHLDLVLTATGDDGAVTLWLNDGKGHFTSAGQIADKGVSPCLGDVDNDGDLDLWLGRAGEDLLFLNDGKGKFTKAALPPSPEPHLTASARLLDVDGDGDLDLFSLRWAGGSLPATADAKPAASRLWNNNRDGAYPDSAAKFGLALPETALAAVVCDDFDNDRDLDLVLLPAGKRPIAWVNDRVGQFHLLDAAATGLAIDGAVGATSGDPFRSGNRDLLVFSGKGLHLYRNRGNWKFELDKDFETRFAALGGTSGQFVDIDNDGDLDLVIADAHRRDGTRGPVLLINDWPNKRFLNAAEVDPGNLLAAIQTKGDAVCVAADFNGDGRCDILLAEMGQAPRLIENATKGGNFVAVDLLGTEERGKKSRSNNSAIGARVDVRSGSVWQQFVVGSPSGATAMPPLRLHFGLGQNPDVQWLRILWPDAVLQAELETPAGRVAKIAEVQRKPSSCPHLFAWDGSRFEFVSDFGGMGGLGYLTAPGQYAPPDPTEYVPIPKLEPRDGQYVVQVLEPLEEVVYFDEAKLLAVDHPEGTEVYPNEMAAVSAPPPAFELFCVREPIEPIRATDHRGSDVTEALRRVDRLYAGATEPDHRFHGFAKDHAVELDFGDRLGRIAAGSRLVLLANGWVEYGYSSTNYAAAQAGLRLKAPSVEVERGGRWVELFHEAGYPAGLQHWMTLDLSGKLLPTDRKLRITSNMELYWDRIFLAAVAGDARMPTAEVAAESADLHFFGYPREYSPDGRQPNLYDYTNVDRYVPWKLLAGRYTRYGEVGELLAKADDCFAIMGPGEELTLRFPASALPPVQPGSRRTFLLKTDSYCKDMDLYTAMGDTIEPLPFHAMRSYPYGPDQRYPDTAKTRQYRQQYNTREVRSR